MKIRSKLFVYLLLAAMLLAATMLDRPGKASAGITKTLSTLSQGDIVGFANQMWYVLNPYSGYLLMYGYYNNGAYYKFSSGSADFAGSSIETLLDGCSGGTGGFYGSLSPADQAAIQEHTWSLTDDAGGTEDGSVQDYVGLLSYNDWNNYSSYDSIGTCWTVTPYSGGGGIVWTFTHGGYLSYPSKADSRTGAAVRPALYLNSDTSVSVIPFDPSKTSVTANPTGATTGSNSTVTVTLEKSSGTGVSGVTVQLAPSTSNAVITPAGGAAGSPGEPVSAVTNSSGMANFTVTDSTAETVTFTATDTTDDSVQIGTANVQFNLLAPTVTSPTATDIMSTTATLGGDVTSDGGASLSKHGILYSLASVNGNPTLGGTGVTEVDDASATTGIFSERVTGLMPGIKYSYAAFATNSAGTGYTSPASSFTALALPTISAAFNPTSIPLNRTSTLTFTITNPNPNTPLTGVAFTDNLPWGLVVATPNDLTNTCGGMASATAGSGRISLMGGTLLAGASGTVTVNVTGTTAGVKNNTTGAVSSTQGGTGNTATANLTVAAPPTVTASFSPAFIPVNGMSVLTFTITNPNPTATLTGVGFTDVLPSGLRVATLAGESTLSGTFAPSPGDIAFNLGSATLPPYSSGTVTVNVTGTTTGVKNNTTGAVSSTQGGTGNTATANLTVVAPVRR